MGLDGADLPDDGDGKGSAGVSCSICLEAVSDNGDRSWAKLLCGHQFHLDCIGSAFNIKGAMQCPNCRKIERGQWLFSNGSRQLPEFSMDDWGHDEDLYELSYSEMSFGVHWCPFGGLTRLPSSFDEGEFSSTAYHELLGQHAIFAEHAAISSASHPCPYIAYFGPVPHSSSSSGAAVSDGSNFNNHWNSGSVPNEMTTSYALPSSIYHNWEHHSTPFPTTNSRMSGAEQPSILSVAPRAARTNSDISRPGSFMHPFIVGHSSSAARAGSSVGSSMIPSYPGIAARNRDRMQALQAYSQQPSNSSSLRTPVISGSRRSSSHRSVPPPVGPVASSSDQPGGFYFFPSSSSGRIYPEQENPLPNRYHGWERDHLSSFPLSQIDRDMGWGPFHQVAGGSDATLRANSFRQRHGSERMPSHNRS